MNKYKLFDSKKEANVQFLLGVLDYLIGENSSDAAIICRLQEIYDTSCWFEVITFAGKFIYGEK